MSTDSRQDSHNAGGFWTPARVLLLLMMLALLVRVAATMTRSMIQFDETAYVRMAENLASGNGLLGISGLTTTHFTPLLPLMIAGLAYILGDYILAGYVIVTVFGVIVLVPTYLLGKEMASERVGLMAAALMAVSPIFVGTTEYIYTENLYIFFQLMAIFFAWNLLMRWRYTCAAMAGASLGLAYLANPSAVYYLLVFVILAVVIGIRKGVWKRSLKVLALMFVLFLVFALPYVIFLHGELGKWTFSGKESFAHNNFAATHNLRRDDVTSWEKAITSLDESGDEIIALSIERIGLSEFFLGKPLDAAKIFLQQTYLFYRDVLHQVFPLWLLPLVGLGLFAAGWDRGRALRVGFLLLMMAPALLILAMYAHPRFFMPFVPMVMIWVGMGWQRLESWGTETSYLSFGQAQTERLKRLVPWLVGAAVLLPVLAMAGAMTLKQDYPVEYKEAGQWLRQEAGEGSRVMNRDFSSAYYAGGTAVLIPTADYDDTVAYAERKDVEYMIIRTADIEKLRPGLERLLADDASHPEWQLIQFIRPGTERETRVYRFLGAGGRAGET